MMHGDGKGWFDGFGDGYTGNEGNGSGQSTKEKLDYCGTGVYSGKTIEEASCTRLLTDAIEDINFYLAQLHLMVQRTTTLKEETK